MTYSLSNVGPNWGRWKRSAARRLHQLAGRLDPVALVDFKGGTLSMDGVPLARITAGSIVTNRPIHPGPPLKLGGEHVLTGRFGCGCVAILCPQEPEILYLPSPGGCEIGHSTRH